MCKAYKETAKKLNTIIHDEIYSQNSHFSYEEIILKLVKTTDYPFQYSTRESVLDRLEHLRALGKLRLDSNNKYSKNAKRNIYSRRRRISNKA